MAEQGVLALITLFLCAVLDIFFDVEECCCNSTCEQEAAVGLKGTKGKQVSCGKHQFIPT